MAYIRGQTIAFSGFQSRQHRIRQSQFLTSITELEDEYASSPSSDLYKKLLILKSKFDTLATMQAESKLLQLRHTVYESGERPSKLLAYHLRQVSANNLISKLAAPSGMTTDPQEINSHFKDFFSLLYKSEQNNDPQSFDSFFNLINMPQISTTQKESLDKALTADELIKAISSMQSGKSPGPDGLPIEFFKKFSTKITPLLLNMLNDSPPLSPTSLSFFNIKKNKDLLYCSSYCPISMLMSRCSPKFLHLD